MGGSLDAVLIDKDTRAYVGSGAKLDADQNISIQADSTEDILSVGASIGASGNTNVMGSLAGYSVDITTQAVLGDNPTDLLTPVAATSAHAKGSVLVDANDRNEMDFISVRQAFLAVTQPVVARRLRLYRRKQKLASQNWQSSMPMHRQRLHHYQ